MNRIGIDLGGTKIEGVLLSPDNTVIERKRIPTKQDEGYESIIQRIVQLIRNRKLSVIIFYEIIIEIFMKNL